MIRLENYEVVGFEHAIRGMRNPMNSWDKSDSVFIDSDGDWYTITGNSEPFNNVTVFSTDGEQVYIGPNDLNLMKRLRNAGTDHRKFMRMITVYVDITAPLYWWKEFDTYRVGVEKNSCSTMHKIHAKEFTLEDFSCEHLTEQSLKTLKDTINMLNMYRDLYISKTDKRVDLYTEMSDECYEKYKKDLWWQMIQLLPSSYNQKRTVMLNYEVLANIYKNRKGHRLDEWKTMLAWVEALPYAELITGGK